MNYDVENNSQIISTNSKIRKRFVIIASVAKVAKFRESKRKVRSLIGSLCLQGVPFHFSQCKVVLLSIFACLETFRAYRSWLLGVFIKTKCNPWAEEFFIRSFRDHRSHFRNRSAKGRDLSPQYFLSTFYISICSQAVWKPLQSFIFSVLHRTYPMHFFSYNRLILFQT